MDLYEMEVALLDGLTLTYTDLENFTQCYVSYVGADTVLHTRDTDFDSIHNYMSMPELLTELAQDPDTDVQIFQY